MPNSTYPTQHIVALHGINILSVYNAAVSRKDSARQMNIAFALMSGDKLDLYYPTLTR